MTTLRTSSETDRRHLLADSTAPSAATSILNFDGDATPRARSPAPSTTQSSEPASNNALDPRHLSIADPSATARPYKGFRSEAAYLEAFYEWAESQKYVQNEKALQGWYGETTMEELASRPRMEFGLRKKWRSHRQERLARRASTAV